MDGCAPMAISSLTYRNPPRPSATHQNGPPFNGPRRFQPPSLGIITQIYLTIFETFWNMLVYHQPHNLMILIFLTIYHVLCGELRFTLSFTTSTVRSGSPQRLRWTPHSWALPHLAWRIKPGWSRLETLGEATYRMVPPSYKLVYKPH